MVQSDQHAKQVEGDRRDVARSFGEGVLTIQARRWASPQRYSLRKCVGASLTGPTFEAETEEPPSSLRGAVKQLPAVAVVQHDATLRSRARSRGKTVKSSRRLLWLSVF